MFLLCDKSIVQFNAGGIYRKFQGRICETIKINFESITNSVFIDTVHRCTVKWRS